MLPTETSRKAYKYTCNMIRPQVYSEKSLVESVVDFFSDVVPQVYSNTQKHEDKEKIQWVRFENCDCNDVANNPDMFRSDTKGLPLLLILGYSNGVQIWHITCNGEAQEIMSIRQGPVKICRILPNPDPVLGNIDMYSGKRPLAVLCDSSSAGKPYCGVKFVSLKAGDEVHSTNFQTTPIQNIECNKRFLVIVFLEKVCVFEACQFQQLFWITSCYPCSGPNVNPIALNTRWLAYADQRLVAMHQSCGGMSGDGSQSYAATVFNAAKGALQGLSKFGEAMMSSVTGSKQTPTKKEFSQNDNCNRPGIVSVVNIQAVHSEYFNVNEDNDGDGLIAHFHAHANEPVALMSFDPTGTLLLTSCILGHNFHVFRLMAHPVSSALGAVHHLYTLYRGETTAKVIDINFNHDSRWVTVSSHRGTTHIFPITPYGGAVNVRTHCRPHVVNRSSRFHRSAGLDDIEHSTHDRSTVLSTSPSSSGQYDRYPSLIQQNTLNNNMGNPRLPPYPHPITIYPSHQIKQPLNVVLNPSNKNQSPSHSPTGFDNVYIVCAKFSSPRMCVIGSPKLDVERRDAGKRPVESLFIMAQSGTLVEYVLEPKAKSVSDKVTDDCMMELNVIGRLQWNLQRQKNSLELRPPLPSNSPVILAHEAVLSQNPTASDLFDLPGLTRQDSKDSLSSDHSSKDENDEQWLSQVEIVTHAGPHRRLWMGPQFSFKTYQENTTILSSNSPCLLSQSPECNMVAMDMAGDDSDLESLRLQPTRSNPVSMPNVRPAYKRLSGSDSSASYGIGTQSVQFMIEAGSYDQSPHLLDVYSNWIESTVAKQPQGNDDHEEDRLKETLADAMNESPLKEIGKLSLRQQDIPRTAAIVESRRKENVGIKKILSTKEESLKYKVQLKGQIGNLEETNIPDERDFINNKDNRLSSSIGNSGYIGIVKKGGNLDEEIVTVKDEKWKYDTRNKKDVNISKCSNYDSKPEEISIDISKSSDDRVDCLNVMENSEKCQADSLANESAKQMFSVVKNITCDDIIEAEKIKQCILDAKKNIVARGAYNTFKEELKQKGLLTKNVFIKENSIKDAIRLNKSKHESAGYKESITTNIEIACVNNDTNQINVNSQYKVEKNLQSQDIITVETHLHSMDIIYESGVETFDINISKDIEISRKQHEICMKNGEKATTDNVIAGNIKAPDMSSDVKSETCIAKSLCDIPNIVTEPLGKDDCYLNVTIPNTDLENCAFTSKFKKERNTNKQETSRSSEIEYKHHTSKISGIKSAVAEVSGHKKGAFPEQKTCKKQDNSVDINFDESDEMHNATNEINTDDDNNSKKKERLVFDRNATLNGNINDSRLFNIQNEKLTVKEKTSIEHNLLEKIKNEKKVTIQVTFGSIKENASEHNEKGTKECESLVCEVQNMVLCDMKNPKYVCESTEITHSALQYDIEQKIIKSDSLENPEHSYDDEMVEKKCNLREKKNDNEMSVYFETSDNVCAGIENKQRFQKQELEMELFINDQQQFDDFQSHNVLEEHAGEYVTVNNSTVEQLIMKEDDGPVCNASELLFVKKRKNRNKKKASNELVKTKTSDLKQNEYTPKIDVKKNNLDQSFNIENTHQDAFEILAEVTDEEKQQLHEEMLGMVLVDNAAVTTSGIICNKYSKIMTKEIEESQHVNTSKLPPDDTKYLQYDEALEDFIQTDDTVEDSLGSFVNFNITTCGYSLESSSDVKVVAINVSVHDDSTSVLNGNSEEKAPSKIKRLGIQKINSSGKSKKKRKSNK